MCSKYSSLFLLSLSLSFKTFLRLKNLNHVTVLFVEVSYCSRDLQENNGIAKLDLKDPFAQLSYFNLGRKDWSGLQFDGAYEDKSQCLNVRSLQTVHVQLCSVLV